MGFGGKGHVFFSKLFGHFNHSRFAENRSNRISDQLRRDVSLTDKIAIAGYR